MTKTKKDWIKRIKMEEKKWKFKKVSATLGENFIWSKTNKTIRV